MKDKFKGVKKFIFETSVIIIGISIYFWLLARLTKKI